MTKQSVVITHDKLIECAEAAFMASAGYRLRGGWEFLDVEGRNRWTNVAQEVLHAAGFEVVRPVLKVG